MQPIDVVHLTSNANEECRRHSESAYNKCPCRKKEKRKGGMLCLFDKIHSSTIL